MARNLSMSGVYARQVAVTFDDIPYHAVTFADIQWGVRNAVPELQLVGVVEVMFDPHMNPLESGPAVVVVVRGRLDPCGVEALQKGRRDWMPAGIQLRLLELLEPGDEACWRLGHPRTRPRNL